MAKTPSRCRGCQSYSNECKAIIGFEGFKFRRIFRERYCPCTLCVVKPICRDKIIHILHNSWADPLDKCPDLKTKVTDFKDYLKKNNIRKTILKRKKRK